MDRVDPLKIPSEIQAYYQRQDVETVLKTIGRSTPHNLWDAAMMMVLYDTGVRATELCLIKIEDLDWRDWTIIVTGRPANNAGCSLATRRLRLLSGIYESERSSQTGSGWGLPTNP